MDVLEHLLDCGESQDYIKSLEYSLQGFDCGQLVRLILLFLKDDLIQGDILCFQGLLHIFVNIV